jgi:predicted tellurium resistance membrane protein TerC
MESLFSLSSIIPFLTLCGLELILGIDNVIFISILSSKLPKEDQQKARTLGLSLAVMTRVALLLSISWLIGLTALFTVYGLDISGRNLILLTGGLFLIAKSTHEIHQKLEADEEVTNSTKVPTKFVNVIIQILLLDIVFSLDSVITAVGMVSNVSIMISAVVVSTFVMIFTAGPISNFVEKHPTIKILALSFLLLIGVTLITEGLNQHISKGYIYFSMAFSLFVETINIRMKKKSTHVHLKKTWK